MMNASMKNHSLVSNVGLFGVPFSKKQPNLHERINWVAFSSVLCFAVHISADCFCTHFRAEQWLFKLKSLVLLWWLKRSPTELDTDAFWILHFPLWILIRLGSFVRWVGWFLTTSGPLQNLFSIVPRQLAQRNLDRLFWCRYSWARYS